MPELTKYSRTLRKDDYQFIGEIQHIKSIRHMLQRATHRFEHEHRAWEYGLACHVIQKAVADDPRLASKTILDVGGGGSVFAPAMAWLDYYVHQVDPGDVGSWIKAQSEIIQQGVMKFDQVDFFNFEWNTRFDFVTCLSVIEHVVNDLSFFKRLLWFLKPGGVLVLTTDFHPSANKLVDGHLRTYNAHKLLYFADQAVKYGFELYGSGTDYDFFNTDVHNYTFASLVLVNNKPKEQDKKDQEAIANYLERKEVKKTKT